MFVVNSRLGFSSAAGSSSNREGLHQLRPSFSRSYGCILPSSLTRVFPRTLGFSPRLPVSVLVRVHDVSLEAFLDSVVRLNLTLPEGIVYLSVLGLGTGICLYTSLPPSTRISNRALKLLAVSLHPQTTSCSTGIFACCPSPMLCASAEVPTYPESTSVAQDPLGFRWIRFSRIVSLLIPAFSLPSCPAVLPVSLQPAWNAPLPMLAHAATSVLYLSPGYFRRRASRPVSYYALFEWWLLLSQHPGCLGTPTSFST